MKNEYAVSEIIGAVVLIGIVMGGMAILGVILLSTPTPEKTPKASISSYCVRCDLNDTSTYEIIVYHGGGEPLARNNTRFYLQTEDGIVKRTIPWWVYKGTPEDCMFSDIGDSGTSSRETWSTSDYWMSGETIRFRFNSSSKPAGMDVRYYPYNSPMIKADFKNEIRNSTCVKENNPTECYDPTGELTPILKSVSCPAGCYGECQAVFTYSLGKNADGTEKIYSIPIHDSGKPWNNFVGSNTTGTLEQFDSDGSEKDLITVTFFKQVEWRLGRSIASGVCE
ncbi:MAG: type IV pilin N-terminal domain-containing protein [Methanospirillum sp.]|uniref:type IV pilin N-terminal domain-containing protein n=1 Tax=Methanospirillum sp. TaxID=45200 RepID=UPI0023743C90|nr:type IV pilin N-terminal domain-containing protein [Methanospirillum sp.]MDD1728773.1 type IV pilin N-terminal domain-containing protein [Methanospirillum sp.]